MSSRGKDDCRNAKLMCGKQLGSPGDGDGGKQGLRLRNAPSCPYGTYMTAEH